MMNDQKLTNMGFASLIILGFFAILGSLIFFQIPPENKTPIEITLGTLGTLVVSIVNYYFGSSSGSKSKDEVIKTLSAVK